MRGYIFSLFVAFLISSARGQTKQDEQNSNYVEVKFYNINEQQWNDKGATPIIQSILSTEANRYCNTSLTTLAACSLNSWNSVWFGSGQVEYLSGYPKEQSPYYVMRIAISFANGANYSSPNSFVIPRDALSTIISNVRTSMNDETGFHVVYLDSTHYSPPVHHTLNLIMILITIGIVLIITILLIALHYWRKNLDEEEERKERLESKSRNTGFGNNSFQPMVADSTPSLQRGNRGHLSPYSQSSVGFTIDSARSNSRSQMSTRLPPLAEDPHKKHKKHKRSRRNHESGDSDRGHMNNGYVEETNMSRDLPPPSNYERRRDHENRNYDY